MSDKSVRRSVNLLTPSIGLEAQMESQKKQYNTPELIVHGNLRKITRKGGVGPDDVPIGPGLGGAGGGPPTDLTS